MGQQLSFIEAESFEYDAASYQFFSSLQTHSLETFIQRSGLASTLAHITLEQNKLSEITWKKYFDVFCEIREDIVQNSKKEERQAWHIATLGYAMERDEEQSAYRRIKKESSESVDSKDLSDDYTDDEGEIDAEDDEYESNEQKDEKITKKPQRLTAEEYAVQREEKQEEEMLEDSVEEYMPGWNSQIVSPIFFGYKKSSQSVHERAEGSSANDRAEAEVRALNRAKDAKLESKESLEKRMVSQSAARLRKIEEVKKKYAIATDKRNAEFNRNQDILNPTAFKLFTAEWRREKGEADKAFQVEVVRMELAHSAALEADKTEAAKLVSEISLFDDAVGHERPTSSLIEAIAKIEIRRWTEELHNRCSEMSMVRDEYTSLKNSLIGRRAGKEGGKGIDERSMASVSLTRLRECQKAVQQGLVCLADAELLLHSAIRLKSQEEGIFPLFKAMAVSEDECPRACSFPQLLCAAVIIMKGSFDQRANFLLQLFNPVSNTQISEKVLQSVLIMSAYAMYKLKLLPFQVTIETIDALIARAFIDFNHHQISFLSRYEAKQFLNSLICRNRFLADFFGVDRQLLFSSFQRNIMNPVTLLEYGILDRKSCKHVLHYQSTRYHAELKPERKILVHDLAMNMGTVDPIRTEYRKLLKQSLNRNGGYINVEPLNHGQFTNLKYIENSDRQKAATKIQSLVRSFKERRFAEMAAKQQAFLEAKDLAIQEIKNRLITEFKERESSTGIGRMKWDAQVRLKQGKLRAAGQPVSRGDTVMVMMEEAVQRAVADIEAKSKEIQNDQDYCNFTLTTKDLVIDDPSLKRDIAELFGIAQWFDTPDIEEIEMQIETPRPDAEEESNEGSQVKLSTRNQIMLSSRKIAATLEGSYVHHAFDKGENKLQREFRIAMALSAPESGHLLARLRAIDSVFTVFKVNKFLSEVPSKRLLLKMVQTFSTEELAAELQDHFKFPRNEMRIATTLKAIATSDFEVGLYPQEVANHQHEAELALQVFVYNSFVVTIKELFKRIESRVAASTDNDVTTEDMVNDEIVRTSNLVKKYLHDCQEISDTISRNRLQLSSLQLSLQEVQRQDAAAKNLNAFRCSEDVHYEVKDDDRKKWAARIANATNLPESNFCEQEVKFTEISAICNEFIETATSDALIIIREYYLPNMKKTIHILSEEDVDGRSNVCGRGVNGRKLTFEAHNIVYKLCLDDDGIFNGSDEYAAKAGGNERIFSMQYSKCHLKELHIPLIATIDYFGFRILASSVLPTAVITYSDKGEVRKITEELVHGVTNKGDFFLNRSRLLQNILSKAASTLNLAEHSCKGFKDIAGSNTFCSATIKVYKGENGDFYMKEFWNAYPAELPEATPHLTITPRGQSVFWRKLRPEFCSSQELPISPDAGSAIIYNTLDQESQYDRLMTASRDLVETRIPLFVNYLVSRSYDATLSEGFGLDLAAEMHIRGINVRHIGLVRSLLWRPLPGSVSLYHHEKFIRTTHDVRFEVKSGYKIKLAGMDFIVTETPKNKIQHDKIPIDRIYDGTSVRGVKSSCGISDTEKNCTELRSILLCEMVARAIKNIIRSYLRIYTQKTEGTSHHFMISVLCEFLNVITGASDNAERLLCEIIYEGIHERYGPLAVFPSERGNLHHAIKPCIPFTIKRLLTAFRVKVSLLCFSEFHRRPDGFAFSPSDVESIDPIRRHNVSFLPYSEAMLATLKAYESERNTFRDQVLIDGPVAFFQLYERKGSKTAINLGVLGELVQGSFSKGCHMYLPGPIIGDAFSKSVGFDLESRPFITIKYHEKLISVDPSAHFSFEIFARCLASKEIKRVAVSSGRFSLIVSRDNFWTVYYICGIHEVKIIVAPCKLNKFEHIVCTFDGTTARCYIDSALLASIEVEAFIQAKINAANKKHADQYAHIDENEKKDREWKKTEAQIDADEFFNSKEGTLYLSATAAAIMESADFIKDHLQVLQEKRDSAAQLRMEATTRAKIKYTTDLYLKKVQDVAERYYQLRQELQQRINADEQNMIVITRRSLFLGAEGESNNHSGSNSFVGDLSCFAVYNECLSGDRIRRHYLSAIYDKTLDASRMFHVASLKFEEALNYTSDILVVKGYAQALCGYLKMDKASSAIAQGKNKILSVIKSFEQKQYADALAEILKAIPLSPEYAELACAAFNAILYADSAYLSRGKCLSYADIAYLPKSFSLDEINNPLHFIQTAAAMYQHVVQDVSLQYIYGEVNLSWIPTLKSPELVIAIVQHAFEDKCLNFIVAGKLFRNESLNDNNISDEDIKALARNLPLTVGYDLSGCKRITISSIIEIARNKAVVAINLDGCCQLDDDSVIALKPIANQLELLSLEGLKHLTDDGLIPLLVSCSQLTSLNLNNCSKLTQKSLFYAAQSNKNITRLHAAAVYLNDEGLLSLCNLLPKEILVSIDISFCRDITDCSVIALADSFRNLQFINACGLSRLTGKGLRAVCENCWDLRVLNFEDLFLLNDSAFIFSLFDGNRKEQMMLTALVTVNLRDCTNLTDTGALGLIERCRSVQELYLRGCDKLTDKTMLNMTNQFRHPTFAFSDHLVTLDVSFCQKITANGILACLSRCPNLENLNVSGIPTVSDDFINGMCLSCPTIVKLTTQRCSLLSDIALCTISKYLWIEYLDVSFCSKVSDEGVEVLCGACAGIIQLKLKKLGKLTRLTMKYIQDYLKMIKLVDVSDSVHITTVHAEVLKGRGVVVKI